MIPESLSEVDSDELANIGISNYQDIVRAVIAFIKKKEAYWKSMISKYLIKGDVSKDRVLAECNAASEIRLLIETLIDTYSDKLNCNVRRKRFLADIRSGRIRCTDVHQR